MNTFISTTIELWPVEKLIPYDRNARTHSDEQIEQIARSAVRSTVPSTHVGRQKLTMKIERTA